MGLRRASDSEVNPFNAFMRFSYLRLSKLAFNGYPRSVLGFVVNLLATDTAVCAASVALRFRRRAVKKREQTASAQNYCPQVWRSMRI